MITQNKYFCGTIRRKKYFSVERKGLIWSFVVLNMPSCGLPMKITCYDLHIIFSRMLAQRTKDKDNQCLQSLKIKPVTGEMELKP